MQILKKFPRNCQRNRTSRCINEKLVKYPKFYAKPKSIISKQYRTEPYTLGGSAQQSVVECIH